MGVDSYVGEFAGNEVTLTFNLGRYSSGYLKEAKKPAYIVSKESIGGLSAKVVSPRTPGKGITGVYSRIGPGHNALCLWGRDLTGVRQELVLKMFETIRFGGPMLPSVIPPPPAPRK
jgi:hypothetical protein